MNKDICLAICRLLKQLRTAKIDKKKLLFDQEDNQKLCTIKARWWDKTYKIKTLVLDDFEKIGDCTCILTSVHSNLYEHDFPLNQT